MIAKVMLVNAGYALSREFDYTIPKDMEEKAAVGMRVIVPFGVRNGAEEAIITKIGDTSEYSRLKPIKRFMDESPVLTEEQISLCVWMQEHYLCTFAQAYKQVRPPRVAAKVHLWLTLIRDVGDGEKLTPNQTRLTDILKESDGAADYNELAEMSGIKNLKRTTYALSDMGIIEIC